MQPMKGIEELPQRCRKGLAILNNVVDQSGHFIKLWKQGHTSRWGEIHGRKFEPRSYAIGSAGIIEVPRYTCQGKCLKQSVHSAAGAFEFLGKSISIPATLTHNELQHSKQTAQAFALAKSSVSIAPRLVLGHLSSMGSALGRVAGFESLGQDSANTGSSVCPTVATGPFLSSVCQP